MQEQLPDQPRLTTDGRTETEPAAQQNAAVMDDKPENREGQSMSMPELDDGEAGAANKKGPTLCGVCEAVPSKYKCSRCYLPYCSIPCNKAHLKDHPPDSDENRPQHSTEPPDNLTEKPTGPPNPFRALENSEKLTWLFRKYPNLPQQLLDIHATTLPPPEDVSKQIPASLMQGVPRQQTDWNRDKGIGRGKAALRRARLLPGDAGEGIREYCLLVLMLLNADEENKANEMLQKQFAQQDMDVIQQLMDDEQARR
ncbi:hypothetical protein RJ55_03991 [Drechmeria coniospora]|nr:hypothetical protein RJ55_03991 [Drechmeria coniospora]